MSLLFYRRPDYMGTSKIAINQTECQRYVERAKNSERAIPPGLSFDNVINNKSLPPCSLNDFMDYLHYVEFNAENLQFFLWLKDYTRRFEALPESERALSPEWTPVVKEVPDLVKNPEKEERRKKRETTEKYETKGAVVFGDDEDLAGQHGRKASLMSNSTTPSTIAILPSLKEVTAQGNLKWQPFTIQPMRDEINRVMRHYLAFSGPRELNLSHKDRGQCLHALQHTTHPSALAPAARIAEATLRGQSHPNFIRWSICNGNKPRVFFVRAMGVSTMILGSLVAVLLTLSSASRYWRILAAMLWYIGMSTMVAAYKGLCVILHHSHSRNLRPWEQDLDSEMGETTRSSVESSFGQNSTDRTVQMSSSSRSGDFDDLDNKEDMAKFRNSNLSPFGNSNSVYMSEPWLHKYEKKPLLRKVFEKSVWTQDESLRILQNKIVLGANLWALIITIPLTVIFVVLPKGNFY